jgi:hypothetical protein
MSRTAWTAGAVILVLVLIVIVAALPRQQPGGARSSVIWDEGRGFGAEIIDCPGNDCRPLFDVARAAVERSRRNHGVVIAERVATLVCTPDGSPCTVNHPFPGTGAQILVVLDFERGPRAIVTCLTAANTGLGDWRGVSCDL